MDKLMQVVAHATHGKSYNTYKYSYDSIGIPAIDYDDEQGKVIKWQDAGETERHSKAIDLKAKADAIQGDTPLIRYFLDGSRHVFKVDDVAYNKQVFPVVAGQIGVGCCRRDVGRMFKEDFHRELIISLPDKSNAGGWDDDAYFASVLEKLNQTPLLQRLNLNFSAILPYSTARAGEPDVRLEDRGISRIQDRMIEEEKKMVERLTRKRLLNQDNYLLKDGSLEYKIMRSGREDLRMLQKIRHNYSWVIGVSKSFNPESCKDHKGKPNSDYIANLPVYHRTPVAKYVNPQYLGDVQFAVWYIRLREKQRTNTPFDGVVKVEKILMDSEEQYGMDSDVVDLISANILNERNPTCYGSDRRWSNHLYPVYLTESFVKSQYISDELFLSLF